MSNEPSYLWVPTFDGVQLGTYKSQHPDVDGECGCALYWRDRIALQLGDPLARDDFKLGFDLALGEACRRAGMTTPKILGLCAENTDKNRKIAYQALRAAWRELGYE